ncbi:MAG: hypothetical protein KQH63_14785 [Desulfobulbaceae bacterium]|nr:hypothetical protein [Desulfobulbaceae bacterium]
MLFNIWSVALTIVSLCALFLVGAAFRTAVRVLRYWDHGSDSNRQISLESEIWLSSTLVEYGLGFQIISLVLLVMAADQFALVISGAMCATGSLLANEYGMPLLLVKLAGVFLYGFWIVLHQLDIRSETYPLVRLKYGYLLLLLPFLLGEIVLQVLYLINLSPDIITSCCAVVFGQDEQLGRNLIGALSSSKLMFSFYIAAGILFVLSFRQLKTKLSSSALSLVYGFCWIAFFILSLVVITVVVSSYIYAMPYHHCPFCILKPEYNFLGYPIFAFLMLATFAGLSSVIAWWCRKRKGLARAAAAFRLFSIRFSMLMLVLFILFSSWHYWSYMIAGGE